jgi:hypothetical protein
MIDDYEKKRLEWVAAQEKEKKEKEEREAVKLKAEQLAIWEATEKRRVELANRAAEAYNTTEARRLLREASAARQNAEYWRSKS